MTTPRANAAAALTADGLIHVAGGQVDGTGTKTSVHEAFDALANTWSGLTALPAPQQSMAAATGIDGRFYVFGGSLRTTSLVYDGTNGVWVSLPSLPTGRSWTSGLAAPDGKIYVIGGDNLAGTPNLKTVEAFDPKASTWATAPSMPTGRGALATSLGPDGRIYAFGGDNDVGAFNAAEVFDTTAQSWSALAPMPVATSDIYADLAPDGRIFVAQRSLGAYSVAHQAWETIADPAAARHGAAVVRGPDGRIYLLGGFDGAGVASALVEAYGPVVDLAPPSPRAGDTVSVGGSNFGASASVAVHVDASGATILGTGQTDAAGKLTARITVTIPTGLPAGSRLAVVDDRSGFPVTRPIAP
jgi:hypothetical protein